MKNKPEKKPKLIFAPGAFDGFEGTQEELDALIAEIQKQFEDGTLFEDAVPVSDLSEEEIQSLIAAGEVRGGGIQ